MNPNDIVRIKPTESGWSSIIKYVDDFNDNIRKRNPSARFRMSLPIADNSGYITGQFWCLMQYFDWQNPAGSENPFYDMQLEKQQ